MKEMRHIFTNLSGDIPNLISGWNNGRKKFGNLISGWGAIRDTRVSQNAEFKIFEC